MSVRTRFCAEPGGCDDPACYLCRVVPVKFPQQPPTHAELKRRELAAHAQPASSGWGGLPTTQPGRDGALAAGTDSTR